MLVKATWILYVNNVVQPLAHGSFTSKWYWEGLLIEPGLRKEIQQVSTTPMGRHVLEIPWKERSTCPDTCLDLQISLKVTSKRKGAALWTASIWSWARGRTLCWAEMVLRVQEETMIGRRVKLVKGIGVQGSVWPRTMLWWLHEYYS